MDHYFLLETQLCLTLVVSVESTIDRHLKTPHGHMNEMSDSVWSRVYNGANNKSHVSLDFVTIQIATSTTM